MGKWKIPLYKVLTDQEDIRAVNRIIKRGMDWAIGPEVEDFEKLLANYIGADYCLTFNSGTSALHAALITIGAKRGDEIIVPSFTFIATANSVLMVNASPKFVDIEQENLGLDPSLIKSAISNKTKFIIPVHYAGLPCKINEIVEVANKNKILIIEDAAEAIGATVKKKKAGTFGDLAIFSFAGNKVLTTGEGGAIMTNSKKMYEKLKLIRSHGRLDKQNYFSSIGTPNYITIGYNWRMSSMTAALGISQLNKIEKLINLRRKNAQYLSSRLGKLDGIRVPVEPNGYRHAYQLYSIRLPSANFRKLLMQFLSKKGIMSKIFFEPIHLTNFYKRMGYAKKSKLDMTKTISDQILTLPMYPGLKKEDLDYICNSVKEFTEINRY